MALVACRECGAWVNPQDSHCFDCGIKSPTITEQQVDAYQWGLVGASIGAGVGGVIGYSLYSALSWFIAFPALILGGGGYALGRYTLPCPPDHDKRASQSLLKSEMIVKSCLEDMLNRSRKIWSMMHRLNKEGVTDETRELYSSLERLSIANEALLDRYRAELWRIDLIRWLNRVEAFADGVAYLDAEGLQRRLDRLPLHLKSGQNMFGEWKAAKARATEQGERCIHALAQAIDACRELHQRLMERHALLLSREIEPIREALGAETVLPEVRPLLEAFHARVKAHSVYRDVASLHQEHQRIQSEQNAIRQVEALTANRDTNRTV